MPVIIAQSLDHPDHGNWAMVRSGHRAIICGAGHMTLEDGPEVDIAYTLRRDVWGVGYATEVARGRRMIVLINGPFGIGKTSTAHELVGMPPETIVVAPLATRPKSSTL